MDLRILSFLADHRIGAVTWLARRLMDIGTNKTVLAVFAVAFAGYVVAARRWRMGIAVGASFIAASLVTGILKEAIGRSRPPAHLALVQLRGFAMPSTHAARTAAIAAALIGTLTWVDQRTRLAVAELLIAAVVLIGVAMVYLGGHWPTDVVVGWILGGAIGWAFAAAVIRVSR